jgi:hypothetical protein
MASKGSFKKYVTLLEGRGGVRQSASLFETLFNVFGKQNFCRRTTQGLKIYFLMHLIFQVKSGLIMSVVQKKKAGVGHKSAKKVSHII